MDRFTVPFTLSGTIKMTVFNCKEEEVSLMLEKVHYVKELYRRLFLLMSLIEQDHDILLFKKREALILFDGENENPMFYFACSMKTCDHHMKCLDQDEYRDELPYT